MQSQCIRVKLLPGKTEQFLAWARTLNSRLKEVKESLLAEGMLAEIFFFDRQADGDYVTLYTKAQSLVDANKAFERSQLPLDQEAKKVMTETWDFKTAVQVERLLEIHL